MLEPGTAGDLAFAAFSDDFPSSASVRLLVFADQYGASQAIAFTDGLANARRDGSAAVRLIEEDGLAADGDPEGRTRNRGAIAAHLDETAATAVVLSRFGHADAASAVLEEARVRGVPVFCHIDDDLFGLPPSLGVERYGVARHPRRMAALRQALAQADLVIAATPALAERVTERATSARIGALDNGAAGRPWPRRAAKAEGESLVIGYMGSASHSADLQIAIPAILGVLEHYPHVTFELFGSIARQPVADRLPTGVVRRDAVAGDYAAFRRRLNALSWDIAIAPLEANPYNRCKTATKWVEYAEAGAAVLASDMEVYHPMIAEDAAAAARPGQWEHVLNRMIASPDLRDGLVRSADRLLRARFSWRRLESSVLDLLARGGASRIAA